MLKISEACFGPRGPAKAGGGGCESSEGSAEAAVVFNEFPGSIAVVCVWTGQAVQSQQTLWWYPSAPLPVQ